MKLSAPALALLALASTASAQQVVLDFEDLSGFAPMTPGYGGIADWGSWAHSDLVDVNYPPFSGINKILSVGLQQSIVFGQDLVFDGARVVTALDFSFELFYQGALVHTTAIVAPNPGGPAVWLDSGYTGLVDEMRYVSAVNVHGVDDFTYTMPGGTIGTSYCTGAVNSTGVAALITASGSDSLADDDLTLEVTGLPDQPGVFFFGTSQNQVPFGNGFLCVGAPIVRLAPPVSVSGGSVSRSVDIAGEGITTGAHDFQFWYRDPAGGGSSFNLTDAVEVVFVP